MAWGSIKKFFANRYGTLIEEEHAKNTHIQESPHSAQTENISPELHELRDLIDHNKERMLTGLLSLDTKIQSQKEDIANLTFNVHRLHQSVDALKVGGQLVLELNDRAELTEKRMRDIEHKLLNVESTLTKRLVNLSELNNQRLVNVNKENSGLHVGSPTYENQQQEPLNLEMFTKRLVNLSRLTRTERAVLVALYDLQADIPERGVAVKELVDRIYGKKAKHSKMVYLSKLTKDMAGKGLVEKGETGPTTKVHLTPSSVEFCSKMVYQKN